SVRAQNAFSISLNRFLTFRPGSERWLVSPSHISFVFLIILIPLLIGAAPPLFGTYRYVANAMEDLRKVYRPELPMQKNMVSSLKFFCVMAFGSCILNAYVVYRLLVLRRNAALRSLHNNAIDRGLAITSVSTIVGQMLCLGFLMIMIIYKTKLAAAINIIPLT
ncbi:hypothetical protein PENTCL1PPCAC_4044, partial [Pristionchus entomophagus]